MLVSCTWGVPVEQAMVFNHDGSYQFNFDTGKDAGSHQRQETRNADGSVFGRYSYEDPNGNLRVVNYRAGRQGFVATGDVGVPGAPQGQVPLLPVNNQAQPVEDLNQENPVEDPSNYATSDDASTTPSTLEATSEPIVLPDVVPDKEESIVEEPKEDDTSDESADEGGKKREAGHPPHYSEENYSGIPFPVAFAKRRLEIPEDKPVSSPDNRDKPAEHVYSSAPAHPGVDSATAAENPMTGPVNPVSFIYSVGSPFIPSLNMPADWAAKNQHLHTIIPEGKGVARYYISIPNHHYYYQTPNLFYVPGSSATQDSRQNSPANMATVHVSHQHAGAHYGFAGNQQNVPVGGVQRVSSSIQYHGTADTQQQQPTFHSHVGQSTTQEQGPSFHSQAKTPAARQQEPSLHSQVGQPAMQQHAPTFHSHSGQTTSEQHAPTSHTAVRQSTSQKTAPVYTDAYAPSFQLQAGKIPYHHAPAEEQVMAGQQYSAPSKHQTPVVPQQQTPVVPQQQTHQYVSSSKKPVESTQAFAAVDAQKKDQGAPQRFQATSTQFFRSGVRSQMPVVQYQEAAADAKTPVQIQSHGHTYQYTSTVHHPPMYPQQGVAPHYQQAPAPVQHQTSAIRPIVPSPLAYVPVVTRTGQQADSQHASGTPEKPATVLAYIQPDSVKFIPAASPVQKTALPVKSSAKVESVEGLAQEQPLTNEGHSNPEITEHAEPDDRVSLRNPVYHQYAFKSPNAAYGYHYQY